MQRQRGELVPIGEVAPAWMTRRREATPQARRLTGPITVSASGGPRPGLGWRTSEIPQNGARRLEASRTSHAGTANWVRTSGWFIHGVVAYYVGVNRKTSITKLQLAILSAGPPRLRS